MRKEYDIEKLNPRKNPYAKKLKTQITMNVNNEALQYFKNEAVETGIPYQTLINLYLLDCAHNHKKLNINFK